MSLEVYLPLHFLEEFEQDRCQLFSKFLVEFSCEAVWTGAFVCSQTKGLRHGHKDPHLTASNSKFQNLGALEENSLVVGG